MAKAYKCDCCGIAITDPFTVRMKEFYWGCEIDEYGISPVKSKRRRKIHLCGNCFEGIAAVAKTVLESRSGAKTPAYRRMTPPPPPSPSGRKHG